MERIWILKWDFKKLKTALLYLAQVTRSFLLQSPFLLVFRVKIKAWRIVYGNNSGKWISLVNNQNIVSFGEQSEYFCACKRSPCSFYPKAPKCQFLLFLSQNTNPTFLQSCVLFDKKMWFYFRAWIRLQWSRDRVIVSSKPRKYLLSSKHPSMTICRITTLKEPAYLQWDVITTDQHWHQRKRAVSTISTGSLINPPVTPQTPAPSSHQTTSDHMRPGETRKTHCFQIYTVEAGQGAAVFSGGRFKFFGAAV